MIRLIIAYYSDPHDTAISFAVIAEVGESYRPKWRCADIRLIRGCKITSFFTLRRLDSHADNRLGVSRIAFPET